MIPQIFLIVYIVLAGTVGAWWLAGGNKKEITLLDLIAWVLPSILLIWLILTASLLDKIKIKKFK
jgi:hypothetical protein